MLFIFYMTRIIIARAIAGQRKIFLTKMKIMTKVSESFWVHDLIFVTTHNFKILVY